MVFGSGKSDSGKSHRSTSAIVKQKSDIEAHPAAFLIELSAFVIMAL